ncbi:DNA-binding protein [Cupriavidus sp. USMAA2-4]|uniref:DUF4055 domain-containing protein n=1 Tax=Cupriavidus sp. USMAA2-4 TaxID=876364 RepID=UPI0008A704CB|nr:DUF4055 domain-containing protein [Cupriavidus sp. USMAA2-4]AOY93822.1 DNA-binding protein [Cupriavidus sp. USMAA2-4]
MSDVRTPSKAVMAMAEDWPLIAALMGGTAAMRAAGKTYLPQWPNEPAPAYQARLATATLFPAFSRTVEVLTGKPFAKPLTLSDDVPARIQEWAEDIDLQGRNLHAFADSLCAEALGPGLGGILVDFPQTTDRRGRALYATRAAEQAAGVRPYFVQIRAGDILGWRSKRINGVETLIQLRLLETVVEDDGPFGEKEVEQVRVLYPGHWEVWRKSERAMPDGRQEWILHDKGKTSLPKIPFAPFYGKRTGFMTARPPLAELAHMNVEHWQSKSDQQTILHVARVPILFAKMLGESPITVGGASAVKCEDVDGDLRYVEHSGAAIEAGRLSLLDLEDRMRQVGAELLVIKPGNTSVTQTRADNEPGTCALQRIVQGLEDTLDCALQLGAEWVGENDGGHVQIFQDFGVNSLAEASLALLREMNVDGTLSDETLFRETQRRGVVSPELDWEGEQARIARNRKKPGEPQITD